jgi:hypothetical protein
LFSILRHRNKAIWLNPELYLLRGFPSLVASIGIETLFGGGNWFTQCLRPRALKPAAFGQVELDHQRAKINWLMACDELDETSLINLVDNLTIEAGLHDAKFLLASIENHSEIFDILHRMGFCIYGWEQYWQLTCTNTPSTIKQNYHWERTSSLDRHEINKFQRKFLSPTVRAITLLANEVLPDFVLKEDGIIRAYAHMEIFGNRGIISSLFDTCIYNPASILSDLINKQTHNGFLWYIAQTSGQDWMDSSLAEIANPILPRMELLVKYFAIMEKLPVGILNRAGENSQPDPVAPFIHSNKS